MYLLPFPLYSALVCHNSYTLAGSKVGLKQQASNKDQATWAGDVPANSHGGAMLGTMAFSDGTLHGDTQG